MKMKKKWLKKTILVLVLTLSLLIIPLFSSSKVNAAINTELGSSSTYIKTNLFKVKENITRKPYYEYLNLSFDDNNYGLVGRGDLEDALFWKPIMNEWRLLYNNILVGCEIVITLAPTNSTLQKPYTIGFTYNTTSGLINQYTGNDAAVTLGTQLCDAKTGMKTYLDLKNNNFETMQVKAIELYMRTEELDANEPNDIEYFYANSSTDTFSEAANYILTMLSQIKGCYMYNYTISPKEAYDSGVEEGYIEGEGNGYNSGYNSGYNTGYEEGYTSSGYGIETVSGSILSSFFGAFWTIASFEIFGIQLWTIPAIIGGVGLIWVVIKFFLGKGD